MAQSEETVVHTSNTSAPRKMDRTALTLLSLGHLFDDVNQGALPAMLPFFIAAHNMSYETAAGLVLALTMSSSVLQPFLGEFSDRHSAPWLVPAGLFLAGAGIAISSVMPGYLLIAAAVFASGVGVAAFHPEAARFANYASGPQRATGMSIFSLGGNMGFGLGPALGSLIMVIFGLRGGWMLIAPPTIMAAILALQLPRFRQHRAASVRRAAESLAKRRDQWGPFLRLSAAIIIRSVVFYGLNTFIPLYWRDDLHESAAAGGLALTIMFISGATGTLAGGWMADRYGRLRVVLSALLVNAASLFAFTSVQDPTLATLLLIPLGFSLNAPSSVMVVMGQEFLPNRVGTASGVTLGLSISIGGLFAPILGRIADLSGIHYVLSLLVFVPLVAFLFAATLLRESRTGHRAAS